MFNFAFIPLGRNIQIAIATAVFLDIFRPVLTGAYNIGVFYAIAGRQTAGAGHIPVAVLVD
jgi:hypothetical protein